jgi:anti-sigma-K factor RskA
MRDDGALVRLVGDWEDRFATLDDGLAPVVPPTRVWRAIAARTAPPVPFRHRVALWRGVAGLSWAASLALLAWIVWAPTPPARVLAVLGTQGGQPAWVALSGPGREARITVAGAPPVDATHDYELWAIAGAAPRPLGVLPREPGAVLALPGDALPGGGVLAVSLEPRGGSPTGLPTGPVLWQGRVLAGG